ncbi:MAG: TfoX/Sxy family protein [Planctomycetes bacterium]|nr:TfoX/Sxy family protein [Planctomycetota bacterium]
MAYSEKNAGILRDELARLDGLSEKRMFGGLCFMLNGNMLCGVHKDGGMARVGKANEATALELDGIDPLSFTGRKMGGMVDISEAAIEDEKILRAVLSLAREFVESLPPK